MDTKKLMELLNISDKNNIWLKEKNGKYLHNNPYQLMNCSLFNSKDELCDDLLARLIRGEIIVDAPCHLNVEKNEKYYFLNEKLEIKMRKNKDSLVDYNNILIGNVFKSEDDITEKDKERLASIINMLKEKKPLFTSIITDTTILEKIREIIETEKKHGLQLEKSPFNNILKKASCL